MTQSLTHYLGLNLEDYNAIKLSPELFIGYDLEKIPENCLHYLIHAVQFQLQIPSLKSMLRSQQRNKNKIGKSFGQDPIVKPKKALIPKKTANKRRPPTIKYNLSKSRSVSSSLSALGNASTAPKRQLSTLTIQSPQQIILKSLRIACQQQLASKIKQQKQKVTSVLPVYFKKKHASHKRRLKQRRELIRQNKGRLIELYGQEIKDKNWRMGIKDIKNVLGIKDDDVIVQNLFNQVDEQ